MKITAEFVASAAGAAGFPHDGTREVALVGRSNVGKSSLINALVRQRVARTSAAPGKTRLVNIYRVTRGGGAPFYLVDLPGYGYARGESAKGRPGSPGGGHQFEPLLREYFARGTAVTLLLVDSRHPGLESDRAAWTWMRAAVEHHAIVATKIDKLSRAERIRHLTQLESALEHPVLPASAVTGEGLNELWKLIDKLANNLKRPSSLAETARRPPLPKN